MPTTKKRMRISLKPKPAMTVQKEAIGNDKLVYLMVPNKQIKYQYGRSSIAYIGTTRDGANRIASSAAARAEEILALHGVNRFDVRVVTCPSRKKIKSEKKLERAFLLAFRERFGEVPKFNTQGKKIKEKDEFDYFVRRRIKQVIDDVG